MREIITLEIGQCGNQIGEEFWKSVLGEHGSIDEPATTFFAPQRDGSIKARSLLIDMEEGVLNSIKRQPLGQLFANSQYISSVDGSGNNFAEGFVRHGGEQKEHIIESLRRQAEQCDCLQGFFTFNSLAGGTGSGLGSRVVELAREHYTNVEIISNVVSPGAENDVITAPYNQTLALSYLAENSNLVIPFDNKCIFANMDRGFKGFKRYNAAGSLLSELYGSAGPAPQSTVKVKAYDKINGIIAKTSALLSTSMRFGGEYNIDLNEISQNLAPFSQMNFACAALSDSSASMPAAIRSLVNKNQQLTAEFDKKTLAAACVTRGSSISEVLQGVQQIQKQFALPEWGLQGFKVGSCEEFSDVSALLLSNGAAIAALLKLNFTEFKEMRGRKMYLHHYLKYFDEKDIDLRAEIVDNVIEMYEHIDGKMSISQREQEEMDEWNQVIIW